MSEKWIMALSGSGWPRNGCADYYAWAERTIGYKTADLIISRISVLSTLKIGIHYNIYCYFCRGIQPGNQDI